MTEERPTGAQAQSNEDIVAAADIGARNPAGATGKALLLVALAWSLFQLWYASPLPFILKFGILNSTEARSIHLAFAVFLSFTGFPALMEPGPADKVAGAISRLRSRTKGARG